jgi:hypothetical protein
MEYDKILIFDILILSKVSLNIISFPNFPIVFTHIFTNLFFNISSQILQSTNQILL